MRVNIWDSRKRSVLAATVDLSVASAFIYSIGAIAPLARLPDPNGDRARPDDRIGGQILKAERQLTYNQRLQLPSDSK
ncbi:MAG: hypothetical protein SWY16_17435 [Cyanobacteriota bacterium]|nr:hypothetical protein [Cyanobacteriota bacterium]